MTEDRISLSPSLRWRRWRRSAGQLAVVGLALALIVLLGLTVRNGFAARGVSFSFGFLGTPAGFEISEGLVPTAQGLVKFASDMTNAQALMAGLGNTLKVAIVAILLSTLIGVTLGVCRLSTNWLIRKLAFWITEFLRNTPLLIQLTFWYIAVVLQLPPVPRSPQPVERRRPGRLAARRADASSATAWRRSAGCPVPSPDRQVASRRWFVWIPRRRYSLRLSIPSAQALPRPARRCG